MEVLARARAVIWRWRLATPAAPALACEIETFDRRAFVKPTNVIVDAQVKGAGHVTGATVGGASTCW